MKFSSIAFVLGASWASVGRADHNRGIESFSIINTDTGTVVRGPYVSDSNYYGLSKIIVEDPLSLDEISNFSVEATAREFCGDDFEEYTWAIKMCLVGGPCRCEQKAPYALFGDKGGVFSGMALAEGTYTVTALPPGDFLDPNDTNPCRPGKYDDSYDAELTFTVVAGEVAAPTSEPPVATPSPTTKAPVTEPPIATPPPTTKAPVTEPPVATPPPTTKAPVTEPPVNTPPPTTKAPVTEPPVTTDPPAVDLFAHCEQSLDALPYSLAIQELQSPTGPLHSDAILTISAGEGLGTDIGIVWFTNDIVKPQAGELYGGDVLGTQSGHCVQVEEETALACYFNFNVKYGAMTGRITAEALFDLTSFPNGNLVITGGTGDFDGISGSGCTSTIPGFAFEDTTFIYNFNFRIL